jgi:hypothetical protein
MGEVRRKTRKTSDSRLVVSAAAARGGRGGLDQE